MMEWLKIVWSHWPEAFLNQLSMLVLEAFKEHSIKDQLHKMKTELVAAADGMTSVLQPIDILINKPIKDWLRQQYLTWIADPAHELTETQKSKAQLLQK
jgi:hypothetical protein